MLSGKHMLCGMETTMICRNASCPSYNAEDGSRERWTITVYSEPSTGYRGPKDDANENCPTCGRPGETA